MSIFNIKENIISLIIERAESNDFLEPDEDSNKLKFLLDKNYKYLHTPDDSYYLFVFFRDHLGFSERKCYENSIFFDNLAENIHSFINNKVENWKDHISNDKGILE